MLTLALAPFALALQTAVQAPQFELQLVRADAGPVAGAQVRWFEGEAPRDDLGAFDAAALASGKLALADERGRVVIEGARESVNIAASLPGWWGFAFADKAEAGVHRLPAPAGADALSTLVLHLDRDLVFETVGGDGARVGNVPVVLRSGLSSLCASSGADGKGLIRHAGVWWEHAMGAPLRAEDAGRIQPEAKATLEIESIPRAERRPVALGAAMPTASVVLSVGGLKEVLLTVRTTADVAPLDGSYVYEPFRGGRYRLLPQAGGTVEARLWILDRGTPLELHVRRNACSDAHPATIDASSLRAGAADVTVGEGRRTLRVRPHIDGGSRPFTEFTVIQEVESYGGYRSVETTRLASDMHGDLVIDISSDRRFDPLVVVHRDEEFGDRLGVVSFVEPVPSAVKLALSRRGTLQLTLVDDQGVPVANARAHARLDDMVLAAASDGAAAAKQRTIPGDRGPILDEQGCVLLSRPDRDYLDPFGDLGWRGTLSVTVAGFAPAEVELHSNGGFVRLVLPRPATISGRVRSADPEALSGLNLLLLFLEDGRSEVAAPRLVSTCGRDGRFEFSGLRAAGDRPVVVPRRPKETYTLIVRRLASCAQPVELTRREGLRVGPGETLDLGDIEVR